MVNIKEDPKLNTLNHSCAHLMAQAIKHLYPQAKFWVGPVITDGFYYDMDLGGVTLNEDDFPKIEKEMHKIAKDGKRIYRHEISKEEALEMFKDDPYKLDLINHMDEDNTVISCYTQGDYTDLCRGPHVESVKVLKYFKLTKASGAYWKGDANNPMLQRLYGICFETQEDLDQYLNFLEEAKKRDHRKLGKELELFMFSEYGPGFPFWLPNGMILRKKLEDFWYEEHRKEGYQFCSTPIMLSKELWEISGHWNNYKNNMYTSKIDDKEYAIKPMNCPGGILIYNSTMHSYRDLPLRLGELGHVHRHEASGALNGLFRVRTFTQDDAHIFCTPDQLESEIIRLIGFMDRIYKVFNLKYRIELSTRPEEKYIGSIEIWDRSEKILAEACHMAGHDCTINPGDGAFYGPKLDFHLTDSLGREWQCGTIQLDMNLPERFHCVYVDEKGEKQQPIMLHRVIYGSVERFIGILIEHYAGAFPLWLAPIQVSLIPVEPKHAEFTHKLADQLEANHIFTKVDDRNEKLGYRIREAQIKKIPLEIVIGDKEVNDGTVTYRRYGQKEQTTVTFTQFIEDAKKEIEEKR